MLMATNRSRATSNSSWPTKTGQSRFNVPRARHAFAHRPAAANTRDGTNPNPERTLDVARFSSPEVPSSPYAVALGPKLNTVMLCNCGSMIQYCAIPAAAYAARFVT